MLTIKHGAHTTIHFDNDADFVLANIFEKSVQYLQYVSLPNLDATYKMLKEFGQDDRARQLLETYIRERNETPDFWDLSSAPFGDLVAEPAIIEACEAKLKSMLPPLDLKEVLSRIGKNHSWNNRDTEFLVSLEPSNYFDLFKQLKGEDLAQVLDGALIFRGTGDGQYDAIGELVQTAFLFSNRRRKSNEREAGAKVEVKAVTLKMSWVPHRVSSCKSKLHPLFHANKA